MVAGQVRSRRSRGIQLTPVSPDRGSPERNASAALQRTTPAQIKGQSLVMHQDQGSRAREGGLTAVRDFLRGVSVAYSEDIVYGYQEPMYRYFKVAMDHFDLGENLQGGRILRLAFLRIDDLVAAPNLKSFSDLCFLVPHLLLESGRKDILFLYFGYLQNVAQAKLGQHPLTNLTRAFGRLTDTPEELIRYIMILSHINRDTIAEAAGFHQRARTWAENQAYACQRTVIGDSSTGGAPPLPHDHHMIRLESQSVYWAQHLVMQDADSDDLARQWLRRRFEPGFAQKCEALLGMVVGRAEAGMIPRHFARMIETLYVGWLNDYYETQQEWEHVFRWGRRGLSLCTDEQYAIWSVHLEELMRKHGSRAEAEELRKRRLSHDWLESVRVQVEKMTLLEP